MARWGVVVGGGGRCRGVGEGKVSLDRFEGLAWDQYFSKRRYNLEY